MVEKGMFIFGHLGIGAKLVSPWSEGLPRRWLLMGTLLPDLIDKPLYYGLVAITGLRSAELGLISGTRTFGHTALLLLGVALLSYFRRSRRVAALALGMATHLLIDNLGEIFIPGHFIPGGATTTTALLFPFLGARFPIMPYQTTSEHVAALGTPWTLGGELVGLLLLGWEFWKSSHRQEIMEFFQQRRLASRRARHARKNHLRASDS